jgi:hypothetical protein
VAAAGDEIAGPDLPEIGDQSDLRKKDAVEETGLIGAVVCCDGL